jgi:phosphoribosylamine--glycine ligase
LCSNQGIIGEYLMNLLVVGGGGREHAIIKKLKENKDVTTIYALPGNGGIAEDAVCISEIGAKDIDKIVEFAKNHDIDFAVVAPDDPLALGCVDRLEEIGIPSFGPSKSAARIEASKVFSKNLMKKYGIPTAEYEVFDDAKKAMEYLKGASFPIVIKADGLALGKGVLIPQNLEEALEAVKSIMEDKAFGDSGNEIVIEEFLTGPEVSVLAFTDGTAISPMVSSMDHKRAGDGDTGLNTGGMGTIAPNPCYTKEVADVCMETIFLPTLAAMRAEGCPFKGCLYFGLMITPKGPKVIEYNCRFGDPETQVVLPLLKTDLLTVMQAVANETLAEVNVEWHEKSAACVIIASGGYPSSYEKGKVMTLPKELPANAVIYHAGDALKDGKLVTSGGRVLGVTATAPTLKEALKDAYAVAETVEFEGKYMRHDIGQKALAIQEG